VDDLVGHADVHMREQIGSERDGDPAQLERLAGARRLGPAGRLRGQWFQAPAELT